MIKIFKVIEQYFGRRGGVKTLADGVGDTTAASGTKAEKMAVSVWRKRGHGESVLTKF